MTDRETPKLTTEDKKTLTKYLERLNKTIADGDARIKDGDILHERERLAVLDGVGKLLEEILPAALALLGHTVTRSGRKLCVTIFQYECGVGPSARNSFSALLLPRRAASASVYS